MVGSEITDPESGEQVDWGDVWQRSLILHALAGHETPWEICDDCSEDAAGRQILKERALA